MSDTLINLTGHPLHLYAGGRKVRTLDPDGPPFRLGMDEVELQLVDGVEVMTVTCRPGALPAETPGVWLVVSQVAALGLLAVFADDRRHDILYPGPGVSDRGRTVGCRGLRWATV